MQRYSKGPKKKQSEIIMELFYIIKSFQLSYHNQTNLKGYNFDQDLEIGNN